MKLLLYGREIVMEIVVLEDIKHFVLNLDLKSLAATIPPTLNSIWKVEACWNTVWSVSFSKWVMNKSIIWFFHLLAVYQIWVGELPLGT